MQWLRDLETNVKKVTELGATLKDKQALADKYQVGHFCVKTLHLTLC